jgi:hypothetical protein
LRAALQFIARLVAAKVVQKKLSVTLGGATLYPNINNAVIDDEDALAWSDSFVIVG